MANKLDRESAKKSISSKSTDDPELEDALRTAKDFQLNILKENNRHLEATHKNDLGIFGRALGGEDAAPTHVALVAMILGLIAVAYCYYAASSIPGEAEFWGKQTERAIAFARQIAKRSGRI